MDSLPLQDAFFCLPSLVAVLSHRLHFQWSPVLLYDLESISCLVHRLRSLWSLSYGIGLLYIGLTKGLGVMGSLGLGKLLLIESTVVLGCQSRLSFCGDCGWNSLEPESSKGGTRDPTSSNGSPVKSGGLVTGEDKSEEYGPLPLSLQIHA